MISYVTIGVNSIEAALPFYDAVMEVLGHERVFLTDTWIGYGLADGVYMPKIWVCMPINGEPATVGNGSMVGLHAASPEIVDRAHAAGLANGGTDEGTPGRRSRYHRGYYIGYLRDPAGNKLSAFCNTDVFSEPEPWLQAAARRAPLG
jgi:catechol 2,3-dioxygenase-like lactoylglutathione lyase family enzyme